jgi:hypothetical protein
MLIKRSDNGVPLIKLRATVGLSHKACVQTIYSKPLEQNQNNIYRYLSILVFHGFLPAIKYNSIQN